MSPIVDRASARLDWLRHALGDASLTLDSASADASFRSYWRTQHGGRSWIVMDSPPALEDPAPWLEIGQRLAAAGVHVPAVKATDLTAGFLLIEDLGTQLYLPALNNGTVDALYETALQALLRLQCHADVAGLAPYDRAFLQRELAIMPEWFLGRHLGHTLDDADAAALAASFAVLLDSAAEQPRCFVHRDYHSRNLLIIEHAAAEHTVTPPPGRNHIAPHLASPGIIDFQGALLGPITYDLASLLRDCYVAWDRPRVDGWVESYRLQLQEAGLIDASIDRRRFLRWFDLIGLQRHLKVLGIFCRLAYRDGKHGYLEDLPRVFNYVVDVAQSYGELAGLLTVLQRCVGKRDLRQMAIP